MFAKPKEQYQRLQGGGRSRDYMGGDSEPLLDRIVTCTHIGQFLTFFSSLCDIYMFLDDCRYRDTPQIWTPQIWNSKQVLRKFESWKSFGKWKNIYSSIVHLWVWFCNPYLQISIRNYEGCRVPESDFPTLVEFLWKVYLYCSLNSSLLLNKSWLRLQTLDSR